MDLSDNAKTIVANRYLMNGERGWEDVCKRVSTYIAAAEVIYTLNLAEIHNFNKRLYDDLLHRRFIFNSPTLFNAGSGVATDLLYKPIDDLTLGDYEEIYSQRNSKNSLSACFVIPVDNSINGIFNAVREASLITKGGGGVGFNFSHLSHKGRALDSGAGYASGPLSFMEVFDSAARAVIQGGRRRAAQLGALRYDHPDIIDFINAKSDKKSFKFFNLSVLVDKYFIDAVNSNSNIVLYDPVTHEPVKEIAANEIMDTISLRAWENGDPGLIFFDTLNRDGYIKDAVIEATNPCQPGDALLLDGEHLRYISKSFGKSRTWTAFASGLKEVLELTCNNGMTVRFTPEHKIMLSDGSFIKAKDSLNKTLMWGLGNRTANNIDERYVIQGFLFGGESRYERGLGIGVKIDSEKEPEIKKLLLRHGFHQQENGILYIKDLAVDVSFLKDRLFNRKFPEEILLANSDVVASFLQGLFEANGSCVDSSSQISLRSANRDMLKDVQILLASFGIPSWLVTNAPKVITWEGSDYLSRESYDLQIAPHCASLFKQKIGFYSPRKNDRIKIFKEPYKGTLEVVAIRSLGIQDVYDYTMQNPPHHNFCQGVIAANCSEVGTYYYGSCNLGHINLNVLTKDGIFDLCEYEALISRSIHYLDNVIDMNWYPLSEITRFAASYRPVGLGIMGFAHALFKLGLHYDSREARDFGSKCAELLMKASNVASKELSTKRGSYPEFNFDVWSQKHTSLLLPKEVLDSIRLNGIRNATVNTCAPTGCQVQSTLVVTDKGILTLGELVDLQGSKWQEVKESINVATENSNLRLLKGYVNGSSATKKITLKSGIVLECTPTHKYKVLRKDGAVWVEASDLVEDDVIFTKVGGYSKVTNPVLSVDVKQDTNLKSVTLPQTLTPEFAYLLGAYFANGSTYKKGICFTMSASKKALTDDLCKRIQTVLEWEPTRIVDRGRESVYISSQVFLEFLERNGLIKPKVLDMHVPRIIREASTDSLRQFIQGYWTYGSKIPTVSFVMAQQLAIIGRALGLNTCIANQENALGEKLAEYSPGACFDVIKSVENSYALTLDLEVEKEHSYIANSVVSHNTCSLIADTSSGIEPVFSLAHSRVFIDANGKEKTILVRDPVYEASTDPEAAYFVDALHVSTNGHILMQSVWQQYIDQGISKTINMPNSATVEDVRNAFLLAEVSGCKGITVFRDGCREDQVLYSGTSRSSGIIPKNRPKVTYGRTSEVKIGCGTLYVTINLDEDGRPIEAFLTTGKGGGCRASSEGLGRMISVNLRSGIAVEEVIKQLEHIKCPSCVNKGTIKVMSCPDAVARELKSIISDKNLSNGKSSSIIEKEDGGSGIKCEECGFTMVVQEGCVTCPNCGFSRCS